jgi:hypothetical protein
MTATTLTPRRYGPALVAIAIFLVSWAVLSATQPARADTLIAIQGYQHDDFVVQYWPTQRSNTNSQNLMYVRINNDGSCGCGIGFASRPGATSATNARTANYVGSNNVYANIKKDGGDWISAGTFYLSSAVGGNYVGDYGTWHGQLLYNVKYLP